MAIERKPEWLKSRISSAQAVQIGNMLRNLGLNSVCEGANCPNMGECFKNKTVTFMILGSVCTRNCAFCAVPKGSPQPVDANEPENVAAAAKKLGLLHTVVTSVTRDDLADGGAEQFAATVRALKSALPNSTIEVLIPDFKGELDCLKTVIDSGPNIINHNIETVPSLYTTVRPMAVYERSLELLKRVKTHADSIHSKTGIMVGLGETKEEVLGVMDDLLAVGCDMLTIGQYLQPSKTHLPIAEFVHPTRFDAYKEEGLKKGFKFIASGPLVRSSYHAAEGMEKMVMNP
jgi:lipoyl synthase